MKQRKLSALLFLLSFFGLNATGQTPTRFESHASFSFPAQSRSSSFATVKDVNALPQSMRSIKFADEKESAKEASREKERKEQEEEQTSFVTTMRRSSIRSILKRTQPKPAYHLQTLSGGEVLVEKELFSQMSDAVPQQLPNTIPSAVLNDLVALANAKPKDLDDPFDAASIQESLATVATQMNTGNMYDYLQYAQEAGFKGLPLSMLLSKMIDLRQKEIALNHPVPNVKQPFFSFFSQPKIAPMPAPTINLKRVPDGYHGQLAKLYFLATGKGLDFAPDLLQQPECSFSVAELYQWGRLPQRLKEIKEGTLDLSPYRIDSFNGLELLPYVRRLARIRLSPQKHLTFYFDGSNYSSQDDPCFLPCCCCEKEEDRPVNFGEIIFCRIKEEDANETYPPDHRFAHIN